MHNESHWITTIYTRHRRYARPTRPNFLKYHLRFGTNIVVAYTENSFLRSSYENITTRNRSQHLVESKNDRARSNTTDSTAIEFNGVKLSAKIWKRWIFRGFDVIPRNTSSLAVTRFFFFYFWENLVLFIPKTMV